MLPGDLPSTCAEMARPGAPDREEVEAGLAREPRFQAADEASVKDYAAELHTEALLTADWWPEGQEGRATHLCGRWWVSQDDAGKVYAFAPEVGSIAAAVIEEQAGK